MNVLLLNPSAVDHYRHLLAAKRTGPPLNDKRLIESGSAPKTAAQLAEITDVTAILPIHGVIDYRPSWLTETGFCCSSAQLRSAFRMLVAEPSIRKIVLDIDSPGGLYSGVPEFARDIYAAREVKPVFAVANPMAASGGIWLGAAATKFYILGSGEAGSLGALMVHEDASQMFAGMGVKHEILRSPVGKADFNSIEPLTEESRAHHQAHVEQIADEFLRAVAKFRGVSAAKASKDFGQGRMLMAKQAVDAGLADGMVNSVEDVAGSRAISRKRTKLANAQLEEARNRRHEVEAVLEPPLLQPEEVANG